MLRSRIRRGRAVAPLDGPGTIRLLGRGGGLAVQGLGGDRRSVGIPCPAASLRLLLYRCEDLTGLFVLVPPGRPILHLPGRWSPEDVHRFAVRHGASVEIRTLPPSEYVALATSTP
ncbi:hypothetical protein [Microbispora sp. ATCC PTA-5024]|uniref:hypothetical protein n=1 Tax=Microbispora sp. ATCC PTA-5024 TaxID=316330 RepID=UPI0012EECC57|nr:hypothetical protein [Microbispora sp. ATCC PTA-5024]